MPRSILLATKNLHKVQEVTDILRTAAAQDPAWGDLAAADWSTLVVAGGADIPDVVESGVSFAENALLKARAGFAATGKPCLADDSGICVDVMGGAPGIFSARWAGCDAGDVANRRLLLDQLRDIPQAARGARFVCAAVLVSAAGEQVCLGEMVGRITTTERGTAGFGYDPIFMPDGFDVTCAEMSAAQKHRISHRGNAFRELAGAILATLARH